MAKLEEERQKELARRRAILEDNDNKKKKASEEKEDITKKKKKPAKKWSIKNKLEIIFQKLFHIYKNFSIYSFSNFWMYLMDSKFQI